MVLGGEGEKNLILFTNKSQKVPTYIQYLNKYTVLSVVLKCHRRDIKKNMSKNGEQFLGEQ